MHAVRFSGFKVLWLVGFMLIFGLLLAGLVSTGGDPQGSRPQGTVPQGSHPQGTLPHRVTADPSAASGNPSDVSTDADGIASYSVTFADNGKGPQTVRVLSPAHPAAGVAHNFLIVLPVEAGLGTSFGDGLLTLQALDAQDKYNLTIIEPTFGTDPWYANNPDDQKLRYETFMTKELVPWIKRNLATTGHEQVWLIGFSKSGLGAQDLILKHPEVFTLAASWDSPFDASSYDEYGHDSAADYGTDANFQANYRLTDAFVEAHRTPFLTSNRIWIGGYGVFRADDADYDALLSTEGIVHSTETPQYMAHRWDSGWVSIALAALYQDSVNLPGP